MQVQKQQRHRQRKHAVAQRSKPLDALSCNLVVADCHFLISAEPIAATAFAEAGSLPAFAFFAQHSVRAIPDAQKRREQAVPAPLLSLFSRLC